MDSKDFFVHIENHYSRNLPFVIYRKPNGTLTKALLQNNKDLHITEDFTDSGFVFAPFDDISQTVLIPIEQSESVSCSFNGLHSNTVIESEIEFNEKAKTEHVSLVSKGLQAIHQNKLEKVVLSRCEIVSMPQLNPITVLKELLVNYPYAFVYCWYHPKIGLWLGATPETLISLEGKRFKTMALAGTQVFQNSMEVDWKQKEKEEQQFVTNYIKETLNSSLKNLSATEAKTIKAGNLLHLQSNISGILDTELSLLLNKLHPTPAVCGLPVDKAKSFILKYEPYDREYYTGFLGELNLKDSISRNSNRRNIENNAYGTIKSVSHLYVNLRCMQIKNQQAHIYVGGGITKDSNPQLEWQETVSKSSTMKRALLLEASKNS